jgi:hypothetical protein
VSIGAVGLRINQPFGPTPPRLDRAQPCREFLFAHAPSHLAYAIPTGAKEFSAVGYCMKSGTVKFRVFVDGQGVYESPLAGIAPIRTPLPLGARRLDLITDDFDGYVADWCAWCYPRFIGIGSESVKETEASVEEDGEGGEATPNATPK